MRSRSQRLKSEVRRLSGKVKPWQETERKEVRDAVRKTGDLFLAAILLGISRGTIYRKLEKFGLRKA